MTAYYNENDPKAAAWLKELIKQKHIAHGEVDERSITEIRPADLEGFKQCHFFAGVGGWSYALRLANWPDDKPVLWTGSCPCQPFSVAGKGKGLDDERHLWPAFRWLIAQRRPSIVFGEQVASKDGRKWLSGVRFDLEAMGYGVGAADLCSAGEAAPNIRQRLYWVANSSSMPGAQQLDEPRQGSRRKTSPKDSAKCSGFGSGLGNANLKKCNGSQRDENQTVRSGSSDDVRMEHSNSSGRQPRQPSSSRTRHGAPAGSTGSNGGVGNSERNGLQGCCQQVIQRKRGGA